MGEGMVEEREGEVGRMGGRMRRDGRRDSGREGDVWLSV